MDTILDTDSEVRRAAAWAKKHLGFIHWDTHSVPFLAGWLGGQGKAGEEITSEMDELFLDEVE